MGRKSYLQERTSNPRVTNDIRGDEDGVSSCLGWGVGGVRVGWGWGGVVMGWDGMVWGGVWVGWGGVWVGWDGVGWGWGGDGCAIRYQSYHTTPYHTVVACFLEVYAS